MTKPPVPSKEKSADLPADLKSGIESLSDINMDAVKVHHDSAQPAQLSSHAFTRGNDINTGPGQEDHLPHQD